MTLIDKIKADREYGTAGPWACHFGDDDSKCNCRYILGEYGGMGALAEINVCKEHSCEFGDDEGPDEAQSKANARRIARVPDMEAALLAADALANAVRKTGFRVNDSGTVTLLDENGMTPALYALVAYSKAIGAA